MYQIGAHKHFLYEEGRNESGGAGLMTHSLRIDFTIFMLPHGQQNLINLQSELDNILCFLSGHFFFS